MENHYYFNTTLQSLTPRKASVRTRSEKQLQATNQSMESLPTLQQTTSLRTKLLAKRLKTEEEDSKVILQRFTLVDNLIKMFEDSQQKKQNMDIGKILLCLKEVNMQLAEASKTEIMLNKKEQSHAQLIVEHSNLRSAHERLRQQFQAQTNEVNDLKRKLLIVQNEFKTAENNHMAEKVRRDELLKRVRNLEERLEFAVEKNLNAHKDELHHTFTNLIKETEQLKRERTQLNKEIARHKQVIMKVKARNATLIKKLESLKTKKITAEEKDEDSVEVSRNNHILDAAQIPPSLDFRNVGLTQANLDLITDVIEHGPEAFAFQIVNPEDIAQKRELAYLISSQFLSYLEFSERINQLYPKLLGMFACNSIQSLMSYLSKELKHVFRSEQVALWLMEDITGYLFTYDLDGRLSKVLFERGAFREVFENRKIISRSKDETILLYQSLAKSGKDQCGNGVLLIPILNSLQKTCGILEIGKTYEEKMSSDEQYLAVIVSMFVREIVQKILDIEKLEKTIKYKEIGYYDFMHLCNQKTRAKFVEGVQNFAQKMFCTSSCRFLFYNSDENLFYLYKKDGSYIELDGNIGLAGQIAASQKPFISPNINQDVHFHSKIDLDTLSPVYCQPVLSRINNQNMFRTLAVLQFVIKKRRKGAVLDHQISIGETFISNLDQVDSDAKLFAQLVSSAYMLCENQLEY